MFQRFRRWAKAGVFDAVFAALSSGADFEYAIIDGTIVRVHQQTVIDTCSKVAFAKLNDRVIPFFDEQDVTISHTRTKVKSPQTNGICERFHKSVLDEFHRMARENIIQAT